MFRKKDGRRQNQDTAPEEAKEAPPQRIPSRIHDCEALVRSMFGNSSDVVIQPFETRKERAMVVYIAGLTDKKLIDRDIIQPLKSHDFNGNVQDSLNSVYKIVEDVQTLTGVIINGNTAVFYEKSKKVLSVDFKQWAKRAVDKPEIESVTRGPLESFIEDIRTNTSLLRRKIKNSRFIIESMTLGRQTNTQIELAYIEGIVNREVLHELKRRLSSIDTDSVLESGYIEQYIEERWYSPVSGIGVTMKPDVAASKILEGRIAVLCDGTPYVLTVPELFIEKLITSEDYYDRVIYSTGLRILRFLGLVLSVILPGLYVGMATFNQEMLPSVFLETVINATQKIAFPKSLEALVLIFLFELIQEAGTRLPKTIGGAISIVGSLIIGQAAVSAGIVGAPMVIVISMAVLAGFMVPNLTGFTMTYRLVFLFFGSTMGLIGIGSGLVIMVTHLASTDSFGVPILSVHSKEGLKDNLLRFPLWRMTYRPFSIAKENVKRRNDMKKRWNPG